MHGIEKTWKITMWKKTDAIIKCPSNGPFVRNRLSELKDLFHFNQQNNTWHLFLYNKQANGIFIPFLQSLRIALIAEAAFICAHLARG